MSRPAITTEPCSRDSALRAHHLGADLRCAATAETIAVTSLFASAASSSSSPPAKIAKTELRVLVEPNFDRRVRHEAGEGGAVVDIGSRSQCERGERAIHRSGIEIENAQALRGRACDRRLSRRRGPVDCNLQMGRFHYARPIRPGKAAAPQNGCEWLRRARFSFAPHAASSRRAGSGAVRSAMHGTRSTSVRLPPRAEVEPRRARALARRAPHPRRCETSVRQRVARLRVGMPEFDAVFGGGIVPGSLTLVGGPPGAGKSTLLLQIAARLARQAR